MGTGSASNHAARRDAALRPPPPPAQPAPRSPAHVLQQHVQGELVSDAKHCFTAVLQKAGYPGGSNRRQIRHGVPRRMRGQLRPLHSRPPLRPTRAGATRSWRAVTLGTQTVCPPPAPAPRQLTTCAVSCPPSMKSRQASSSCRAAGRLRAANTPAGAGMRGTRAEVRLPRHRRLAGRLCARPLAT